VSELARCSADLLAEVRVPERAPDGAADGAGQLSQDVPEHALGRHLRPS
jgi:hypothetical protein